MTQPPVSLDEVRSHLNLDDDDHTSDDELWSTTLSATGMVEAKVGPIKPRTQTVTARGNGGCNLLLPVFPVISVETVTDQRGNDVDTANLFVDTEAGLLERASGSFDGRYTVELTVGRDPIPEDLFEAVKLQAGLLWSSQRGPAASSRFSAIGGDGISSPGGLDNKRLQDIVATYSPPNGP